MHSQNARDFSLLNQAFLPVLDYMIAFKPELGLTLQRMVEAYSLLVLDQFTAFYKIEHNHELTLQARSAEVNQHQQAVESVKSELYAQ